MSNDLEIYEGTIAKQQFQQNPPIGWIENLYAQNDNIPIIDRFLAKFKGPIADRLEALFRDGMSLPTELPIFLAFETVASGLETTARQLRYILNVAYKRYPPENSK